ncbi:hypothetical protein [Aquibacillus sediminis]|uniref:hypothetical protein n=1 Tax=Aquibacillus sediminis TaxID=2574734 RepID=UPI001107DFF4|nr:hypothetical protein [Aquibacillus sediminis]
MQLLKKLLLTFFIILFLSSIFNDLTTGTIVQEISPSQPTEKEEQERNKSPSNSMPPEDQMEVAEPSQSYPKETEKYQVVQQAIQPGDTVLSVVESLNSEHNNAFQMEEIINDFKALNPGVDPHQIKPDQHYYFPRYKNTP